MRQRKWKKARRALEQDSMRAGDDNVEKRTRL